MLILTIRTDKPESEIGLFDDDKQLAYETWQAHRQLAETIHEKLRQILETQKIDLHTLGAVIAYKGPGSFTGLRIGLSVANAIAASYNIPIVGTSGEQWIHDGAVMIRDGRGEATALPEYGAPVHITAPKK